MSAAMVDLGIYGIVGSTLAARWPGAALVGALAV